MNDKRDNELIFIGHAFSDTFSGVNEGRNFPNVIRSTPDRAVSIPPQFSLDPDKILKAIADSQAVREMMDC